MTEDDQQNLKDSAKADIRAVESILREWDPIGVEPGTAAPADEYDSYAPYLVSMVRRCRTVDEVASRLAYLASETMGLGSSPLVNTEHHRVFAMRIVDALRPVAPCPACESELGFDPWKNGLPSHDICPHCGIQFGYNDSRQDLRPLVYAEWRREWRARDRRRLTGDELHTVAVMVMQRAEASLAKASGTTIPDL